MSTELEQKYQDYIFKTEIAFVDETCQQRGIFATEDISYGDTILKIPRSECMEGTQVELTYQLMDLDNEYTRSLPTFVTNFPIFWTPSQVQSLRGSAMKEMIPSRKQKLLDEDVKLRGNLFLRYRLMVGSRGFTADADQIIMVPYADMLNHSACANIDWKIEDDHIVLNAIQPIKAGEECVHTYGTKTNYEHLLFYGMVIGDNRHNDITYEMFYVPAAIRKNLNYEYFQNTIEFELCGSYSRGTREIFSLVRFLVHQNGTPSDCPKQLQGLSVSPISIQNELMVCRILHGAFTNIYNDKIKQLKDAHDKVADFVQTEINVIVHWIEALKKTVEVLRAPTRKKAMKMATKMKASVYINQVIRPLILDKRSYINK